MGDDECASLDPCLPGTRHISQLCIICIETQGSFRVTAYSNNFVRK